LPKVLTPFESRWLTEVVRRHEVSAGPLADGDILPQVLQAPFDAETRILRRAELLAAREGWERDIESLRAHARLSLFILALIALMSGFGAALGVLGSGGRPVNVVWAQASLLGVHLFSLLLWLAGLVAFGQGGAALLGRVWWWLSERLGALGRGRRPTADLGGALIDLLAQHSLLRWLSGSISHLLWLMALLGALLGLLLGLSLQRHSFVIETTILPSEVLLALTATLGWLPAKLGFAVPDADMVRASLEALPQDEATRRAWASWLVGSLLTYGILPRLLLWALCLFGWIRGRKRLRLDLSLPGFSVLRARLLPASERIGILDQAPHTLPRSRIEAQIKHGTAGLLVGLEVGPDLPWPPAGAHRAGPIVDSREERKRLLDALQAHPPARLLIALDARLSPDRGSLGYLSRLAGLASEARVLLLGGHEADAERVSAWQQALQSIGLPEEAIFAQTAKALRWLEEGP
jgi:hypothetical protein